MTWMPRRRRREIDDRRAEADAALRQSVDTLHSEVVQLGVVSDRTPAVRELKGRFQHWQERNHFGPNMARIMGEPR